MQAIVVEPCKVLFIMIRKIKGFVRFVIQLLRVACIYFASLLSFRYVDYFLTDGKRM